MFRVCVEMPSGHVSKGFEKIGITKLDTRDLANPVADRVFEQLVEQKVAGAQVLIFEDDKEVSRSEAVSA